jgi:hypothetical protein
MGDMYYNIKGHLFLFFSACFVHTYVVLKYTVPVN